MAIELSSYPLGFRFHPTDAELVTGYLKPKILGKHFDDVIAEVDLCQSEPWELPEKSKIKSKKVPKERVWWFLCRRDYKSPSSKRSKRTTKSGFWKITGQERLIKDEDTKQCIGRKKTLVFYSGAAPGKRTNWVMQEITLHPSTFTSTHHQIDAYVMCKLKRKTDESAETPEGEIHQMESSASDKEEVIGEPNCGRITKEDVLQLLDAHSFEESPEDQFAKSLLCDPDDGYFSDDPFIAQAPSKRPYFSDAPGGSSDTDAEGTNGWRFQGSSSFDSSASGTKKVRHSRMEMTPDKCTLILQAFSGEGPYKELQAFSGEGPYKELQMGLLTPSDNSFSDAVTVREVGPTHITVTGGGSHQKRVQFQKTAYEYGLNTLVGTVLFAVFVRELVVFGSW